MPGGKGKSTGGKAGPKEAAAKSQKSHSAKAGLQVRFSHPRAHFGVGRVCDVYMSPASYLEMPTLAI